jgi:competence protein ComEC
LSLSKGSPSGRPTRDRSRCGRPVLAVLLDVLLPAVVLLGSPLVWADGQLRVDFIDVGQGDAALITSPTGKTVLIDGGPRTSSRSLMAFLTDHTHGPLDLILLTHRHEDHEGGLPIAVRKIGARLFLDAPMPHSGEDYTALLRALEAREVPARMATRGRTIDLGGGAMMTLVGPPDPLIVGSREDVNANSVLVRLTFGTFAVLFMGDAEATTEAWLLSSGTTIQASVLKVAHHGSRYASRVGFLRAVRARIAIISVGTGNRYGHPAPETLGRLARAGATIYRTDMSGNITIETDGTAIHVSTSRGGQETLKVP